MIKEGLIFTHNIEKYKSSLEIYLNAIGVENKITIISKMLYELEILNSSKLNNKDLKHIVEYNQNLLGYYPSYIFITNENNINNSFKFDKKYLSNKYILIKIIFEAKYEDGLYKNDITIPKILYHLSPIEKKEKISKNGLSPRTGNRQTNHPERIYLFPKFNDYNEILNFLKRNDKKNDINRNYTLYEVEMDESYILHSDPNYINGYYTTEYISPYNLKIIKDNL